MPPKRKSDAGADKPSKQRRTETAEEEEEEESGSSCCGGHEHDHEELARRQPFDYYCILRHFFDVENENNDEEEPLEEEELEEQYDEMAQNDEKALKPAGDFPDHKWIAMWETWKLLCEYRRRATYTNPDNFGMHIYNDFNGYGLNELIENFLNVFNDEFKKKTRDEQSVKQMWAISAALIHWLNNTDLGPWTMMDDGDRMCAVARLVGISFLTTLNELDKAGLLKADSEVKDLGLVISLYLYWGEQIDEFDGGDEEDGDSGDVDWKREAVAYAKRAGVDLVAAGCYGTDERIQSREEEGGEISPLEGAAKPDRWGWKKNLAAYTKKHGSKGKIGGENFNILRMSRKERASHAFDSKDPLADISDKDLKEGNLMLQ